MVDGNRRAYQFDRTESVFRLRDHGGIQQAHPHQKCDNARLHSRTENELGPRGSRLGQQGEETFLGGRIAHNHSLVAENTPWRSKVSRPGHKVMPKRRSRPTVSLLLRGKNLHGEGQRRAGVNAEQADVSVTYACRGDVQNRERPKKSKNLHPARFFYARERKIQHRSVQACNRSARFNAVALLINSERLWDCQCP
jgi:hypothetical protein